MKTFTTCAEKKAKQFLNLLQGYTKGIRIAVILIFQITASTGQAWAIDSTDTTSVYEVIADSSNSANLETEEEGVFPSSFFWGMLASAVVAVVALFVFFLILRPHIRISPLIAYRGDMHKEKLQCEVALINKGMFSCNDIRVKVSQIGTNNNGSEKDSDIITKTYLSMKGIFHNENDSTIPCRFRLPNAGIPELLKVSVLAKHSVSGVEYAYKKVFKVNDFAEGAYEKGKFIKRGNTYKQSVMRENIQIFKLLIPISILILVLIVAFLSFFLSCSTDMLIICSILGMLLITSSAVIWQLYIHAKADAYSSTIAYHKIEHIEHKMLIALLGTEEEKNNLRKSIVSNEFIEDAEAETMDNNNDAK